MRISLIERIWPSYRDVRSIDNKSSALFDS